MQYTNYMLGDSVSKEAVTKITHDPQVKGSGKDQVIH